MASTTTTTTTTNNNNNNNQQNKGQNYSDFEDYLVCRAYIAASEDPIKGNAQKTAAFQSSIEKHYDLITEAEFKDRENQYASLVAAAKRSLREAGLDSTDDANIMNLVKVRPPMPFATRTGSSLYQRFKRIISPAVQKFIGIQNNNPMPSGYNDDKYFEMLDRLYLQSHGSSFARFRMAKEYLEQSPKFKALKTLTEKKHERPEGKKSAIKKEKEMSVLEKNMKETKENLVSSAEAKSGFYSAIASALELSMLPSPTRKQLLDIRGKTLLERANRELLEESKKRKKVESDHHNNEVIVVNGSHYTGTSSGVASASSSSLDRDDVVVVIGTKTGTNSAAASSSSSVDSDSEL